jgi:septal ring factor EnvC (AmiA/AmiB activator)
MAEQDENLPLVVAEILIEMHGMNDRLKSVESRLDNVENILLQVVDNIQQLSKAVSRTADVMLQQQQEFNRRFDQRLQESDRRFELLQEADRQQADRLERAIAGIGNRFERLENR